MKRKVLYAVLAAEAALCALGALLRASIPDALTAALSFPFVQISRGLRALSLSGAQGNAGAVALYIAFCLLPALVLLICRAAKKRPLLPEDALLFVLSAALFPLMYRMVNPALLLSPARVSAAVSGGAVYAVLCAYAVLRALRALYQADAPRLYSWMAALMCALTAAFVLIAFGTLLMQLLDAIAALRSANTGVENLGASVAFLIFHYFTDALPYALDAYLALCVLELLSSLKTEGCSEKTLTAARRMAKLCGRALAAIVCADAALCLAQLAFAPFLRAADISISLPLPALAFTLAAFLFARLIAEGKRLKDQNDLFI